MDDQHTLEREQEVIKGVIKRERGIGPGHRIYALLGVKHYDYESYDYESLVL